MTSEYGSRFITEQTASDTETKEQGKKLIHSPEKAGHFVIGQTVRDRETHIGVFGKTPAKGTLFEHQPRIDRRAEQDRRRSMNRVPRSGKKSRN